MRITNSDLEMCFELEIVKITWRYFEAYPREWIIEIIENLSRVDLNEILLTLFKSFVSEHMEDGFNRISPEKKFVNLRAYYWENIQRDVREFLWVIEIVIRERDLLLLGGSFAGRREFVRWIEDVWCTLNNHCRDLSQRHHCLGGSLYVNKFI